MRRKQRVPPFTYIPRLLGQTAYLVCAGLEGRAGATAEEVYQAARAVPGAAKIRKAGLGATLTRLRRLGLVAHSYAGSTGRGERGGRWSLTRRGRELYQASRDWFYVDPWRKR